MRKEHVESIFHDNSLFAIILRADYDSDGIAFFTPDRFGRRLVYINGHF